MKIISRDKPIYSNACGCGGSSSLDGSSTQDDVKAFQTWSNSKGYKDQFGNPLKVDGKFGTKTTSVWSDHGKEFEKTKSNEVTPQVTAVNLQPEIPTKKEEPKGWASFSMMKKLLIIGASVTLVGGIVYYSTKK